MDYRKDGERKQQDEVVEGEEEKKVEEMENEEE